MGTFCEAFGITKIVAPCTARRKAQKKQKPKPRQPFRQPKPFIKKETKPTPKKKKTTKPKRPIVCYKCGKTGHKAFQFKTEQKINELFSGDAELKQKLLALLIKEPSGSESDQDYYAESNDDSEYESSPIKTLNVITSKSQKEFLIKLIEQIPDVDIKKDYLQRLNDLISEEEKSPKFDFGSSSSFNQIFNNYPFPNPFQPITTKQLQTELNELKGQSRLPKTEVLFLKTKDPEIEAKIAMIESLKADPPPPPDLHTPAVSNTEIPQTQFLQTTSRITFQKWYSIVNLVVDDFSINVITLIDSRADHNFSILNFCSSKEGYGITILVHL